ncbi:HD domain-containing protein [Jeotgalibacillus sp. R-1-5s-1]|uniref:HD domain-containing protein n=1 Tax=Jeotgalibacillus sp. R-1-5s-1 TaxID=2555897 RepID=UPI00141AC057|nr:HD domain-containing protein [Jeotgalibacillus sp. R-1-5s-1]
MKMISDDRLSSIYQSVKTFYDEDHTGHGWDHIVRVERLALKIAGIENEGNESLIRLLVYLHDAGDAKLHNDQQAADEFLMNIIRKAGFNESETQLLLSESGAIGFSKAKTPETVEGRIVQDADRLDAIGAVGIARAFTYGAVKRNAFYSEHQPEDTVIQHFYDKLLTLRDRMNTKTAIKIAHERHRFMEQFIGQFIKEWNGKK